jgi:hypothetical protein
MVRESLKVQATVSPLVRSLASKSVPSVAKMNRAQRFRSRPSELQEMFHREKLAASPPPVLAYAMKVSP